jgi:hypothetical protein
MKRDFILFVLILCCITLSAQIPSGFSYQTIVRNNTGNLITNQTVKFRLSILSNSETGTVVYSETQSVTTNAFGIANLKAGMGTPVSGTFNSIEWGSATHFMKVELDPDNGSTFSHLGTTQLNYVPYAFHSKTTEVIPDNSVTSSKIVNGTITAADIQDRVRQISFPANALNFSATSTILSQTNFGILWKASFTNAAFLTIPKPSDWVNTSDVTFNIYFMVKSNSGGDVRFFIRPRSFNYGDSYSDAASIGAISNVNIPANSFNKIYYQTFTIPYSRFGTKSLWLISIQRQAAGETYPDDLELLSVELLYTADQ